MEIPISPRGARDFLGPTITFTEWLPLENDDFITIREGNMLLTFGFTMDSWQTVTDRTEEDLPNQVNVEVHKIFADVQIEEVPDELADFIVSMDYFRRSRKDHSPQEKLLIPEYEILGEQVYTFTLERLNRLLSFIRSEKGQSWLVDHPVDSRQMGSVFTGFNARVKSEDSGWHRWEPTQRLEHIDAQLSDERRLIKRDDWIQIKEFVSSSGKPGLVGELLSGAEALAKSGHRRSALTEAITALEVAASHFSRNPDTVSELGSRYAERLGLSTLKGQVSRLGLTATLNYLFPLIFTEDQLPTRVLKPCQEAINQRQNVVHQGQRDVDDKKLNLYLRSIRQLCSILDQYSQD